jgi:hypothetical protein
MSAGIVAAVPLSSRAFSLSRCRCPYWAGVAQAHQLDSGVRWYWAGTDPGGTVWCAGDEALIYDSAPNTAQIDGYAYAHKNGYCLDHAPAPAGYLLADIRLDYSDGRICRDFYGPYAQNPDGTDTAHKTDFVLSCGYGNYQAEAHAWAALIFAWHQDYIKSPVHFFGF